MRREFAMSEEQLARLLAACHPVPYMVFGGMPPLSPQENANDAWAALGREMGFEHMSVLPISSKGDRFFTAEMTLHTGDPCTRCGIAHDDVPVGPCIPEGETKGTGT